MWPSFTYPPAQMVKTMVAAKVWQKPGRLPETEKLHVAIDPETRLPAVDENAGETAKVGRPEVAESA